MATNPEGVFSGAPEEDNEPLEEASIDAGVEGIAPENPQETMVEDPPKEADVVPIRTESVTIDAAIAPDFAEEFMKAYKDADQTDKDEYEYTPPEPELTNAQTEERVEDLKEQEDASFALAENADDGAIQESQLNRAIKASEERQELSEELLRDPNYKPNETILAVAKNRGETTEKNEIAEEAPSYANPNAETLTLNKKIDEEPVAKEEIRPRTSPVEEPSEEKVPEELTKPDEEPAAKEKVSPEEETAEKSSKEKNLEELTGKAEHLAGKAEQTEDKNEKGRLQGIAGIYQKRADKIADELIRDIPLEAPQENDPTLEEQAIADVEKHEEHHNVMEKESDDPAEQEYRRDMAAVYSGAKKRIEEEGVSIDDVDKTKLKTPDELYRQLSVEQEALKAQEKVNKDKYLINVNPSENDMGTNIIPEDQHKLQDEKTEEAPKTQVDDGIPVLTDTGAPDELDTKKIVPETEEAPLELDSAGLPILTDVGTPNEQKIGPFPQNEGENEIKVEEGGEHVVTETKEPEEVVPETPEQTSNEDIINNAVESAVEGDAIARNFEEFGIPEEDLESVLGFNDLHHEQKLLVAENLKQLAYGHLEEVKGQKFEEMNAGLGRIRQTWNALRRGSHMKRFGKEVYAESMDAGLDFHGEDLQSLVEASKNGPGLKKLENGTLQIQYATGFENLTPEQNESVEKFNVIANEFARTPLEWQYAREGSKERKEYEKKKTEFESSKDFVQELKESEENREAAIEFEARMMEGVEMNQFFNANPDVEKRLATLRDGETWAAAAVRNIKNKGLFMATGAATRHVLTSVMGVAAFPAAVATSGIFGAFKGRKLGYQDIDDRNFQARYGESTAGMEERNVNDITQSTKRLETLIKKIETTEDPVERAAYMGELERRTNTNALKNKEGKLDFGDSKENVGNVSRYIRKMGESRVLLDVGPPPSDIDVISENTELLGTIDTENLPKYFERTKWNNWREEQKSKLVQSGTPAEDAERAVTDFMIATKESAKSKKTNERLEKKLEFHDTQIAEQDKAHVKRKTWEGAKTGMKWGAVGALIADIAMDGPISTKVEEVAGDLKDALADGPSHYGDVVESLGVEDGAAAATAAATAEAPQQEASTFQEMLERAKATVAERGPETQASLSFEHEVQAGDSSWKAIESMLSKGMYTEDMTEVQKTHITDAFKDTLVAIKDMSKEELEGMGFESNTGIEALKELGYKSNAEGVIDINDIKEGDVLNFSKLFNNTELMNKAMENTVTLSEGDAAAIAENLANPQQATEAVADAALETIATPTEIIEPEGGGGSEEVFSSEATAMQESDEGIEFEAPQEVAPTFDKTAHPKLNDFPSWEEWKTGREAELIASGKSAEQAGINAQSEMKQIRESMMDEVRERVAAEEAAAGTPPPQVETPNYTGESLDLSKDLMNRAIRPEEYQPLSELHGSALNERLEDIFIDKNETVARTATQMARSSGAGGEVRDSLRDNVPQRFKGVFDSFRVDRRLEEAAGEKFADATGLNVENNMGQWNQLKTLSMEDYTAKNYALRVRGDEFQRANFRELGGLINSFKNAGIKDLPNETIEQYLLRGTTIMGGVPGK